MRRSGEVEVFLCDLQEHTEAPRFCDVEWLFSRVDLRFLCPVVLTLDFERRWSLALGLPNAGMCCCESLVKTIVRR